MSKVLSDDNHNEILKVEKLRIINDLLSVVDQTKKELNVNSWVHMPKGSGEYQYYKMLCGEYQAFAYEHLGTLMMLTSRDGDLEAYKKVITHFKKARAIYNLVGMPDEAKQMDMKISLATKLIRAVNNPELIDSDPSITTVATSANVQTVRNAYKDSLKTNGINSENTIQMGTLYVDMLFKQKCKIEAERLVTELAIVSRRLLGPEHNTTIRTDVLLEKCKVRNVLVLPDAEEFQALRYENDGEVCVVTGPITAPRKLEDEKMYHIANNLVFPNVGCAVICHGLISALHLNGELGEVRNWKQSGTGIRMAVHFEKKGVRSALVKPENLMIAFELPQIVKSDVT
jgi:hypothetical protein